MAVFIALLRGVNVGGRHKLPMKTLREIAEEQGASDVSTYIQSGNVVFRLIKSRLSSFQKNLVGAIENEFGFTPAIHIITKPDFRTILKGDPFIAACKDASKTHIMFLRAALKSEASREITAALSKDERVKITASAVYFDAPSGLARSRAGEILVRRASNGTMRNLRTCLKLDEMAEALS